MLDASKDSLTTVLAELTYYSIFFATVVYNVCIVCATLELRDMSPGDPPALYVVDFQRDYAAHLQQLGALAMLIHCRLLCTSLGRFHGHWMQLGCATAAALRNLLSDCAC